MYPINTQHFCQGRHGRGAGRAMAPPVFSNLSDFGNFNASSESCWTFAVSKWKGCNFYLKIVELGPPPPTLQVP